MNTELTLERIQQNVKERELIIQRATTVFKYWHEIYEERSKNPDIEEVLISTDHIRFQTREYIGCGDYDYFSFNIPNEVIVAKDYKAVIDQLNKERLEKIEAERLREEEEDRRRQEIAEERRVEAERAELARLEAIYRRPKEVE